MVATIKISVDAVNSAKRQSHENIFLHMLVFAFCLVSQNLNSLDPRGREAVAGEIRAVLGSATSPSRLAGCVPLKESQRDDLLGPRSF